MYRVLGRRNFSQEFPSSGNSVVRIYLTVTIFGRHTKWSLKERYMLSSYIFEYSVYYISRLVYIRNLLVWHIHHFQKIYEQYSIYKYNSGAIGCIDFQLFFVIERVERTLFDFDEKMIVWKIIRLLAFHYPPRP